MVTAKQIWLFVPVDGVTAEAPETPPAPVSFAATEDYSQDDKTYENYSASKNYGQSAVKDPRYGPNSGPNAPCQHPGWVRTRYVA